MATRTLAEELPPPYLDKLRTNDMLADDPEAVAVRVTLCHAMPTRKTDPQGKVFAGKTIQVRYLMHAQEPSMFLMPLRSSAMSSSYLRE